jgi:hypothetical protein
MNEQIRELMLEAGYAAPDIALRAQKFAELILRECIEVANKNRTVMEIKSNTQLTADAIKKHFGVEL